MEEGVSSYVIIMIFLLVIMNIISYLSLLSLCLHHFCYCSIDGPGRIGDMLIPRTQYFTYSNGIKSNRRFDSKPRIYSQYLSRALVPSFTVGKNVLSRHSSGS